MKKKVCFNISDSLSRKIAVFRATSKNRDMLESKIERFLHAYLDKENAKNGISVTKISKEKTKEISSKKESCESCKTGFMTLRSGGKFYGCTNYPKCKKTKCL